MDAGLIAFMLLCVWPFFLAWVGYMVGRRKIRFRSPIVYGDVGGYAAPRPQAPAPVIRKVSQ